MEVLGLGLRQRKVYGVGQIFDVNASGGHSRTDEKLRFPALKLFQVSTSAIDHTI